MMRRRYRAGGPAWGMPTRRRHGALGRTGRSCFFVLCPEPERMSCVVRESAIAAHVVSPECRVRKGTLCQSLQIPSFSHSSGTVSYG